MDISAAVAESKMKQTTGGEPLTVDREFESTLESVDEVEELVIGLAGRAGLDEDERHRLGMAVRECVVNAVVHGNQYNRNKKIRIRAGTENGEFAVRIADQGAGFDLQSLPDPLAEENILRQSGRGIFLIRAFVDKFDVRRLESGGSEVTLVKRLP